MRRSKDLLFYGRLTPVLFDVVVCTPLLGLPFLPCRLAPVPFDVVSYVSFSEFAFCVVSLLLSLSALRFCVPLSVVTHFMLLVLPCPV